MGPQSCDVMHYLPRAVRVHVPRRGSRAPYHGRCSGRRAIKDDTGVGAIMDDTGIELLWTIQG